MFIATHKLRLFLVSTLICSSALLFFLLTFTNRIIAITSTYKTEQTVAESLQLKTLPPNAIASSKTNFSLIVGEWADKGKCNSYRHVFIKNKRYTTIERKQGKWKIMFNGFYLIRDANKVLLGESVEPTEYGLIISKLTSKTLTATLIESSDTPQPPIPISWVRCSNR
jgi:hypothetical protein